MKGYYIAVSKKEFYQFCFSSIKKEQIDKLCGQSNRPMQSVFGDICSYGREYLISSITPMEWDSNLSDPDDEKFDSNYRKECGCDFCSSFAKVRSGEEIDKYIKNLLLEERDTAYLLLNTGNQISLFSNKLWRYSTKN